MTEGPGRQVRTPGALAVVVGSMVGVGILLTPPLVARATHSVGAFVAVWVIGGLVAGCGAATWAELGARMPRAGGDVVFQREAWGTSIAVASGWVMLAGGFAGSIAAMAAAVARWQAEPLLAGVGVELWSGPVSGRQVVAVLIVAALTAVNMLGVRPAVALQGALTWVPVVALAVLGPAALFAGPVVVEAQPVSAGLGDAWLAVYFTFAGWPAIVYVAGDVVDPSRTLPRAMVGGTLLVTALYLVIGGCLLGVFGLAGLRGLGEVGTALAVHALGPTAALGVMAVVGAAILASINGTLLGGARVAAVLAEAGGLPASLAVVDPRGTPVRALVALGAVASGLVLSGGFDWLVSATGLAMTLAGCLTAGAALVLRRGGAAPWTAPWWAPWGYLAAGAAVAGDALRTADLGTWAFIAVPAGLALLWGAVRR
ncbi:MAG: APA family basic amino acid/polyamine antiporter [Myxococcota bacterium]|jgi:APA family basic amino acid/polyamine antiporter